MAIGQQQCQHLLSLLALPGARVNLFAAAPDTQALQGLDAQRAAGVIGLRRFVGGDRWETLRQQLLRPRAQLRHGPAGQQDGNQRHAIARAKQRRAGEQAGVAVALGQPQRRMRMMLGLIEAPGAMVPDRQAQLHHSLAVGIFAGQLPPPCFVQPLLGLGRAAGCAHRAQRGPHPGGGPGIAGVLDNRESFAHRRTRRIEVAVEAV